MWISHGNDGGLKLPPVALLPNRGSLGPTPLLAAKWAPIPCMPIGAKRHGMMERAFHNGLGHGSFM